MSDDHWCFLGNIAVNIRPISHLPEECRAILALSDIRVYSTGDGIVRLRLAGTHRWSNPLPESHLSMFGVLLIAVQALLANDPSTGADW